MGLDRFPGHRTGATSVERVSGNSFAEVSAVKWFDVASPICWQPRLFDIPMENRWKVEYGQWLTCATYPCFTGFQWI